MRDVAVIAYAQAPNVRTERARNEVEVLMPIIDEVIQTVPASMEGKLLPAAHRSR